MSRYFVQLAYNGKRYYGWQRQPKHISVQEVLENAFSTILQMPIALVGAGRTDTGVHARNYYAHFDIDSDLKQEDLPQLVFRLNKFLPFDIAIAAIFKVDDNLHARFDALSRTYRYYISRKRDPFNVDTSYYLYGPLDVEKMNQAAETLLHYQDFTSFSKVKTQTFTNNCKLLTARWYYQNQDVLVFEVQANRFLRNMVRALVGTLLEVGQGLLSVDDFKTIIERKNRSLAGKSVPAQALFLEMIHYPASLEKYKNKSSL